MTYVGVYHSVTRYELVREFIRTHLVSNKDELKKGTKRAEQTQKEKNEKICGTKRD